VRRSNVFRFFGRASVHVCDSRRFVNAWLREANIVLPLSHAIPGFENRRAGTTYVMPAPFFLLIQHRDCASSELALRAELNRVGLALGHRGSNVYAATDLTVLEV